MVLDMLTSPEVQIHPRIAPMNEDGRNSTAARYPDRHGGGHLQDVSSAHDLQRSNQSGGLSARSRSPKRFRTDRSVDSRSKEEQRSLSSERHSTERQEGQDEVRHSPLTEKSTRSCKRKLELTLPCLGSDDATKGQDSGKEDWESPPPAKRWVIGPLLQSFKSKMASFTEIVMSPVRLFKPNELPARTNTEFQSETHEIKEDEELDYNKDNSRGKKRVVQISRLLFDTDCSNGGDSEQNKETLTQNRSEHGRDSVLKDGGSFGSLNSTRSKSTNRIKEVVKDLNLKRGLRNDIQNRESRTTGRVKDTIRTNLKTYSGGTERAKKRTSQTWDQPSARKLGQPTSAVRKRKKGRLAERVKKEGGAKQEEETPTVTQTLENPTLILTVQQISDECISTCANGDVQTWASSRTTRQRKNKKQRKSDAADSRCSDPDKHVGLSNRTSESDSSHRDSIRQAKHKSATLDTASAKKAAVCKKIPNTRRGKKKPDAFEDQGMSMSLTLKVNSGLDGKKDSRSVASCGRLTKGKETKEVVTVADTSCPARRPHEDGFCIKDTDVDVESKETDQQRGLFVCSEIREEELEDDDDPKLGQTSSGSVRLTRSLSCPDITSLHSANDASVASVNETTPAHPSPLKNLLQINGDPPSPFKRPRRHTVCSIEIEREIAPLCLRKEVYPKWSSTFRTHSSTSPSASLVSSFLSSPLAFLSKKSSRGYSDDSGYGTGKGRRSAVAAAVPSSSPSPLNSFDFYSGSAFFPDGPLTCETSSLSSSCSVFDAVSIAADEGLDQQDIDEIQASSDVAEEKALSDSEIKTNNKQEKRRKVSSIRIRKTLPKPQNNLTPMGLPKAVRVKKKVFSVEEIYTNKNFTKPPEGRLETIFEVPVSRRDGSQSLIGPKRVKRFMEFPEVGVARKPKKSVVGGAGGSGVSRKAAGNPLTGRTRRCRNAGTVQLQDLDLILCSKLEELDKWMSSEQMN